MLLQALQSLACPGGGGGDSDSAGKRSSPDLAAAAPEAATSDTPRVSTDQLASLAALLAAEGATSDATLAGWLQQATCAVGGAAGAQLPAPSRRSSVSSMASSQLPMSHGPSLSLDGSLGAAPPGVGLPTAGLAAAFYGGLGLPGSQASLSTLGDPRSTLSIADWACSSSTSPSARESVDALAVELAAAAVQQQQLAAAAAAAQAAAAVLPPAVATVPYEHRLSFDAAMQLQTLQQQQAAQVQAQQLLRHRLSFQGPPSPATPSAQDAQLAALLAQQQQQQQQAVAAAAAAYSSSLYHAAAAQQQAAATAAMRSALYQPAGAAPGPGGVSLAMQSSLYAATSASAPAVPLPAHESKAALAEPAHATSVPAAVQAALASAFYAASSSPPPATAEAAGSGAVALRASLGRPGGEGLPPLPRASSSRSSSPTQLPSGETRAGQAGEPVPHACM